MLVLVIRRVYAQKVYPKKKGFLYCRTKQISMHKEGEVLTVAALLQLNHYFSSI